MTQYPQQPYFDPNLQYASYPPNPRPGSVTALSIIAIILGSIFVLCGGFGLLGQIFMLAMAGKNPFFPAGPKLPTPLIAYQALSSAITLLLAIVLLIGGIGGLKLWPAARRIMIYWSMAMIAWGTINLIVQLVWVVPESAQANAQFQAGVNPRMAGQMSSLIKPLQIGAALVVWILSCILPVCFLTLWRRPQVVASFEGATLPPAAPPYPGGNPV